MTITTHSVEPGLGETLTTSLDPALPEDLRFADESAHFAAHLTVARRVRSAAAPEAAAVPGQSRPAGTARSGPGLSRGRVSFVGAGPGDPELLTVRAAAVLAGADVLIVDASLHACFRSRCAAHVEVVEVEPDFAQPGSGLPDFGRFAEAVRAGKSVVRLLDGDPGLFGSLEHEAAACARAGLEFEVVPGLSRATSVPLFAGIPLTRGQAGEVRLLAAPQLGSQADFTAWSDWHRQLGEAGASSSTLVLTGVGGRVEAAALASEVLSRMKNMELAGPIERMPSTLIAGIHSMPVRFTPARRVGAW